jgi:hypothetical protein
MQLGCTCALVAVSIVYTEKDGKGPPAGNVCCKYVIAHNLTSSSQKGMEVSTLWHFAAACIPESPFY